LKSIGISTEKLIGRALLATFLIKAQHNACVTNMATSFQFSDVIGVVKTSALQTRRLTTSFKDLNSSLVRLAGELWCRTVTVKKLFKQVLKKKVITESHSLIR